MYTAMPLVKGKINVTSGQFTGSVVHCEADGDIEITWVNGGTDVISLVAGDDRGLTPNVKFVTVNSGTFSFA